MKCYLMEINPCMDIRRLKMLDELSKLTFVARQLGENLFIYQQERKFGATELQNMIFELSRNDNNGLCREIWNGYFQKSEEYVFDDD